MIDRRFPAAGLCLAALASWGFAPAGRGASASRAIVALEPEAGSAAAGDPRTRRASEAGRAAGGASRSRGSDATASRLDQGAEDRGRPSCPYGMVGIPGGSFRMGDDAAPEKAGEVAVGALCADMMEVTSAAYAACVESGACSAADASSESNDCNAGRPGAERHPANCVDWHQAKAYCEAQGKRLPTEEEWEYAARGSDGRIFPWGDEAPDAQLCWSPTSEGATCPVGARPEDRSPFGLVDMAGNVREWTATGAAGEAGDRVTRGGGWMDADASDVRAANRFFDEATARDALVGFRCVADPGR